MRFQIEYYYDNALFVPICVLLFTILSFSIIHHLWCRRRSSKNPTNWPVVRMFPAVLKNTNRIHEFMKEVLPDNGGTFEFKGPWFSNMDMLVTCDPDNINHVLSRNFQNYPKGPHFRKIFGMLGDGLLTTDYELWELHRKTTTPLMNSSSFRDLLVRNVKEKMKNDLFPVLDQYAESRSELDLQEIWHKLSFDISCQQFLDHDPLSLSADLNGDNRLHTGIQDGMNAIHYRHILPQSCWSLQKWLFGIDREKKLGEAVEYFDQFIYKILDENNQETHIIDDSSSRFSVLDSHVEAHRGKSKKFLRDTLLTLIIAGGDTNASALTFFFWLLARNPCVESKILNEIIQIKNQYDVNNNDNGFKVEECYNKLVYLHACICESLRLFPSIPLHNKTPLEKDVLPTGHVVNPNMKVLMPFYSMGRMETIWGDDCSEFKPERWIIPSGDDGGGIKLKHQPSRKFAVFNAGPRTCVGKEMAFVVMKMITASIIYRYRCELVDPHHDHSVSFADSFLLEMKYGLNVKLTKRK